MNNFECLAPLANPNFTGAVGIGTVSPAVSLHIQGSGEIARIENVSTATNGYSQIQLKAGTAQNYIWTNNQNSSAYYGGSSSLNLSTAAAAPIAFFTNGNNERMRIEGDGKIGIGTSPVGWFDVAGGLTRIQGTAGGWGVVPTSGKGLELDYHGGVDEARMLSYNRSTDAYKSLGIDGSPLYLNAYSSSNVGIGTASPSYKLHVNGSVAGTSAYNNLSDVRLKKNIRPIADAVALIGRLNGVHFDWRRPDERSVGKNFNLPVNEPQVGFIAQDVRRVLPEAVTIASDPDHVMSIEESKIVPVLVEALKSQQALIEKQQGKLAKLQADYDARFASLASEIARLKQAGPRTASLSMGGGK